MNSNFKRKSHKKEKTIIIMAIIVSFIMVGVFGYLLYLDIKNRPLVDYPKYTLSTTVWTNSNVVITVINDERKISSYSLYGGKSFQNSNIYEVTNNSEVYIVVKDINGRNSNTIPISIHIIDKEPPIIIFENTQLFN